MRKHVIAFGIALVIAALFVPLLPLGTMHAGTNDGSSGCISTALAVCPTSGVGRAVCVAAARILCGLGATPGSN